MKAKIVRQCPCSLVCCYSPPSSPISTFYSGRTRFYIFIAAIIFGSCWRFSSTPACWLLQFPWQHSYFSTVPLNFCSASWKFSFAIYVLNWRTFILHRKELICCVFPVTYVYCPLSLIRSKLFWTNASCTLLAISSASLTLTSCFTSTCYNFSTFCAITIDFFYFAHPFFNVFFLSHCWGQNGIIIQ